MTLVDCGCVARVYPDDSGIELHYCAMHEAAPDLLEACETLSQLLRDITIGPKRKVTQLEIEARLDETRRIISLARGDK